MEFFLPKAKKSCPLQSDACSSRLQLLLSDDHSLLLSDQSRILLLLVSEQQLVSLDLLESRLSTITLRVQHPNQQLPGLSQVPCLLLLPPLVLPPKCLMEQLSLREFFTPTVVKPARVERTGEKLTPCRVIAPSVPTFLLESPL